MGTPVSLLFSLVLATLILASGGAMLLRGEPFSRDEARKNGRATIAAAEKSGFSSPDGQNALNAAQKHLANAIASRPLDLESWELLARADLLLALSSPSPATIATVSKSLSMVYLSGLHVTLRAARHRLTTALWAKSRLPGISLPSDGVKQDIALLGLRWQVKKLVALARETESETLMREALAFDPRRLSAFNYYLAREKRP